MESQSFSLQHSTIFQSATAEVLSGRSAFWKPSRWTAAKQWSRKAIVPWCHGWVRWWCQVGRWTYRIWPILLRYGDMAVAEWTMVYDVYGCLWMFKGGNDYLNGLVFTGECSPESPMFHGQNPWTSMVFGSDFPKKTDPVNMVISYGSELLVQLVPKIAG